VLVYPSQDEIFGLVPLEALLSGTPVVVADDSGCGEIIQDVPGGQVVPVGDAAALSSAIARVLASPDEWRVAAARGGAHGRTAYARPTVCAALESIYSELVPPGRFKPSQDQRAPLGQRREGVETL
jgi:glycosyltransferase involved in cell wall biosynthesis